MTRRLTPAETSDAPSSFMRGGARPGHDISVRGNAECAGTERDAEWGDYPIAIRSPAIIALMTTTTLPGIADRAGLLGTDSAFDLLAEVNGLRAAGRDIVSFG